MSEQDVRQRKKESIYRAALEAYSRYGIHGATTRQIAELAGIGKSTIFEYFRSAGQLMDEAFAWFVSEAASNRIAIRTLMESDPAAALGKYFDDLTRLIVREPQTLLLISQYVTAILASGTDFTEVKHKYGEKLLPSAEALLEDFKSIAEAGIRIGAFRPVGGANAFDCALMINAVAREMQSQALVQDGTRIADICKRLRRMVFTLLGASPETGIGG